MSEIEEFVLDFMKKLVDITTKHLWKYSISIVYKAKGGEFQFASSFAYDVEGKSILVTAGHTCKDLCCIIDRGELQCFRVCYNVGPNNSEYYSLPISDICARWDESSECLDIGFLVLPEKVRARILACGGLILPLELIGAPSTVELIKTTAIVGVRANDSVSHVKNELILPSANGWGKHQQIDVGSIGMRAIPIENIRIDSESVASLRPLAKLDTLVGLSGGMVVEIYHGPKSHLLDFKVVGIQSSQNVSTTKDPSVTMVHVVTATAAMLVIRRLLESLQSD